MPPTDYANQLYLGDCLKIMRELPSDVVDCIFCDILYGTGRDFGKYLDISSEKQAVYDFYMPRIEELKRLLNTTGSIFLMCDYHISHWIRDMLDTIFGYAQCKNEIIWHYPDTMKSGRAKQLPRNHDVILFYAKTEAAKYFPLRVPRDQSIVRERKRHDSKTKRCLPVRDQDGKAFAIEYHDVLVDDVWRIGKTCVTSPLASEFVDYPTQKPIELVNRCIQLTTKPGDVVADFFVGSGTTCVAAMQSGRKYIGCDISAEALSITQARLKKITQTYLC